jgi:hypothetical protein
MNGKAVAARNSGPCSGSALATDAGLIEHAAPRHGMDLRLFREIRWCRRRVPNSMVVTWFIRASGGQSPEEYDRCCGRIQLVTSVAAVVLVVFVAAVIARTLRSGTRSRLASAYPGAGARIRAAGARAP